MTSERICAVINVRAGSFIFVAVWRGEKCVLFAPLIKTL